MQQKIVTIDFLSHKRVENKDIDKQYRIEDNCESIISKEIFNKVKEERKNISKSRKNS